jgi:hypothetical protein
LKVAGEEGRFLKTGCVHFKMTKELGLVSPEVGAIKSQPLNIFLMPAGGVQRAKENRMDGHSMDVSFGITRTTSACRNVKCMEDLEIGG